MQTEIGRKVTDITQLLETFEAQEGTIESYCGGIGQGKTYGATRRALNDLRLGRVVYTNWHLNLDHIEADQRKSLSHAFFNFVFLRKRFYKIDVKKNWHYYDLDSPGVIDLLSSLTDCTVYADEGQDIFDSYEGTKMSKKKRKSLTRTRHLNKTLVIISQRPQAIAVTARANVNIFYKHVRVLKWPFLFFKVLATEDIDAQNMPLFDNAETHDRYFGSDEVFRAYNSKYLRGGIPKSQNVYFDAFDLSFKERAILLVRLCARVFALKGKNTSARSAPVAGGSIPEATLKKDGGAQYDPSSDHERLFPPELLSKGKETDVPF